MALILTQEDDTLNINTPHYNRNALNATIKYSIGEYKKLNMLYKIICNILHLRKRYN